MWSEFEVLELQYILQVVNKLHINLQHTIYSFKVVLGTKK